MIRSSCNVSTRWLPTTLRDTWRKGRQRVPDRASASCTSSARDTTTPVLGRWAQLDQLDQPGDLRERNRYAYAASDPINAADPTGFKITSKDKTCTGVGAAKGVAGAVGGTALGTVAGGPIGGLVGGLIKGAVGGAAGGLLCADAIDG
jgi:RHS repeat-associated protein